MDGCQRKGSTPFFAYIPLTSPTSRLQCPDGNYQHYAGKVPDEVAEFYGMIENGDAISASCSTRSSNGASKTTRWSSSSAPTTAARPACKIFNAGMRGTKATPYQGGTRAPCFWRWPARFQGGRGRFRLDRPHGFFPTLAEIVGVPLMGDLARQVEGRSLLPLLTDPHATWPDRLLVTHVGRWPRGKAAEAKFRNCSIRDSRFTLVNDKELYDLQADPGNRKTSSPPIRRRRQTPRRL